MNYQAPERARVRRSLRGLLDGAHLRMVQKSVLAGIRPIGEHAGKMPTLRWLRNTEMCSLRNRGKWMGHEVPVAHVG